MSGFLTSVVPEILSDVGRPDYLEGVPEAPAAPPASLRAVLRPRGGAPVLLAEYKRVAPGAADPRLPPRRIADFASAVLSAPVAAVSVLATRPRFEGSPADVAEIVRRVPRPVLFKDIVVDPRQVEAARRCGASAVLLIARVETGGLAGTPLADLARGARAAGLEVVLEFHAPGELKVAEHVPADVYGVNARDLETLELDPATAERTARAARGRIPLIGMSGVRSPADAERWARLGVEGLLVGTAVSRAADPAAFLRSLGEEPRP